MRLIHLLALMLLAAFGCRHEETVRPAKPPRFLRPVKIFIAEDEVPAVVSVAVENLSGRQVVVDEVRVFDYDTLVIQRPQDTGRVWDLKRYDVRLVDGKVPLGDVRGAIITEEGGQVAFKLIWDLPENPPPLLTVVWGRFELRSKGVTIGDSGPLAFMLQSEPNVLHKVVTSAIAESPAGDQIRGWLRKLRGKRTPAVDELIQAFGLPDKSI